MNVFQFADDIALQASSKEKLEYLLNEVEHFLAENYNMKFNRKTNILVHMHLYRM